MPDFTILTPVRNARTTLPGCVASVADQGGVSIEHLVLDGASDDGTADWLRMVAPDGGPPAIPSPAAPPSAPALRWLSAPDRGMYDALNRGLALARGEWIAWLNADEQYLGGTLAAVAQAAREKPAADVLYGDCIVVDPAGRCLAWRRPAAPDWWSIAATHQYVPSCALFFRRRVFESGRRFPAEWRIVGDEALVGGLLRDGHRFVRIAAPLAAFTATGANLGSGPAAEAEARALKAIYPGWTRALRMPVRALVAARKAVAGGFSPPERLCYRFFAGDPPVLRTHEVVRPSWRWPGSAAAAAR